MIKRIEFYLDILKEVYEGEYSARKTFHFVFCQKRSWIYSPFYLVSFYLCYMYLTAPPEKEIRYFVCLMGTMSVAIFLMDRLTKAKRKRWHELRRIRAYRGAKESNPHIFANVNIDEAVEYAFPANETLFAVLKNNLGITVLTALAALLLSEIIGKETLSHLYAYLAILVFVSLLYVPLFFLHFSSKNIHKKEYRNWLISCCQYDESIKK